MQDHRKLIVWQRAHRLVLLVNETFRGVRSNGIPGLPAQILRAAAAVPANIVEGCGRRTNAEFARFLDISLGSVMELDYHLLLARDTGLIRDTAYVPLARSASDVRRLVIALIQRVRARNAAPPARPPVASATIDTTAALPPAAMNDE
jgi:four helix bundle protein